MKEQGKPSHLDGISRSTKPDLEGLIAEERTLFHLDDEADDKTYRLRQERIFELRNGITTFPVITLTDVLSKALYVERLYHECGESLTQAIEAEHHSDIGIAIAVIRDLLSCPELQRLLKKPRIDRIFSAMTAESSVRH